MTGSAATRTIGKETRTAVGLLVGAVAGLITAIGTGLAMVPRVPLVDVVTVLAGGIGAGAALVGAIVHFRQARQRGR